MADIYWIMVGRKQWKGRKEYFSKLRDYLLELAELHMGDTHNEAVLDAERAEALGIAGLVVPAPLEPAPASPPACLPARTRRARALAARPAAPQRRAQARPPHSGSASWASSCGPGRSRP